MFNFFKWLQDQKIAKQKELARLERLSAKRIKTHLALVRMCKPTPTKK